MRVDADHVVEAGPVACDGEIDRSTLDAFRIVEHQHGRILLGETRRDLTGAVGAAAVGDQDGAVEAPCRG
ncbi:hypothetical protein D3C87_1930170 [compost metagenome]